MIALGCTNKITVCVSNSKGDGGLDIAASCPTSGLDKIAVCINITNSNATAASFHTSSLDSVEGIKADLVFVANGSSDTFYLYSGNGDGTFDSAESFSIGTGTGPSKVIQRAGSDCGLPQSYALAF